MDHFFILKAETGQAPLPLIIYPSLPDQAKFSASDQATNRHLKLNLFLSPSCIIVTENAQPNKPCQTDQLTRQCFKVVQMPSFLRN